MGKASYSNIEEKEIFRLFNEIKIDESEFDDFEEVNPVQKERLKKSLKIRIRGKKNISMLKYSASAAAILLVTVIGIGTASPAFAKDIHVISYIIQTLNDRFGNHENYAEYTQMVNKTVSSNGIDFTINEVLADDSKMIIGYTIKSSRKIENLQTMGLGRFLQINGRQNASTGSIIGNYTDDCTYAGNEEIHTDLPKDSDVFNVDLKIDDIMGVKGKWDFSFSVSKDELLKNSHVFKPDKKVVLPDSTATIDKIVFSPIDTSVFISGKINDDITDYSGSRWNWSVFDDKGISLTWKGIGASTSNCDLNQKTYLGEESFESLKNVPEYLTFVPWRFISDNGGKVSLDDNGNQVYTEINGYKPKEMSKVIDGKFPIELPQGKMGKIIINEIITENNVTTVRFSAIGKEPYLQAANLFIKDEAGVNVAPDISYLQRDEKKTDEVVMKFKALNGDKKYTIYTTDLSNIEFRDDLKFTVQLGK
ncbi:MAG: DUF4179 domain-containing protein [Clostridiaceae bacterium]